MNKRVLLKHYVKIGLLGSQSREAGSGSGGTNRDYLVHQNKGHSSGIIHEDWKDLGGRGLGISFPDWDLSYFAGGRTMKKVAQPLAPPPNPLC